MKARKRLLLIILMMLAGWISALAASANEASVEFESANKLYEEGKFADAVEAYETILKKTGTSPALLFNLGNARFKSGQIGRALVAYRQAEQLAPRDPDVLANLQFTRNQVTGPTLRVPRWERWLGELSLNEWSWLAAAPLWLTLLLLTIAQLRPQWRQALRSYVLASACAVLVFGACLALALAARTADTAVVTGPVVTVHNGPLEESQAAFTAHDGAELRVLDQKDDWLQVTDNNRRTGWLKRSEVALLKTS